LVTGQNADLVAIKSIIKGDQTVTIYKPLKDLASTALNLANQLIQNKTPDNIVLHLNNGKIDVPSILIPVSLVNKDNIEDVIIKSGFYTKEEVYGK
jgi:D-xylose transport system substrate-binding protein